MRLASYALAASLLFAAGCGDNQSLDSSPDLAVHDEIFVAPADDGVLCAANVDDDAYKMTSIRDALDRARDQHVIVQLFAHDPGHTISLAKLEAILDGARHRQLPFVTYREIAAGATGPGVALGLDDWSVDDWYAQRALFAQYGARVTFFPALYTTYSDQEKTELRELAAQGHDVEFHTTTHEAAPAFVETYGMDAYLHDEVDVGLDAMRADGYDPVVFAYPAGLRTPALDAALLARFAAVRATTLHCPHGD